MCPCPKAPCIFSAYCLFFKSSARSTDTPAKTTAAEMLQVSTLQRGLPREKRQPNSHPPPPRTPLCPLSSPGLCATPEASKLISSNPAAPSCQVGKGLSGQAYWGLHAHTSHQQPSWKIKEKLLLIRKEQIILSSTQMSLTTRQEHAGKATLHRCMETALHQGGRSQPVSFPL